MGHTAFGVKDAGALATMLGKSSLEIVDTVTLLADNKISMSRLRQG